MIKIKDYLHRVYWTAVKNYYLYVARKGYVFTFFENIRNFKHCDGIKWGLYYGKLMYLESNYVKGMFDKKDRAERVDKLIHELRFPEGRKEHIAFIQSIKEGVEQANKDGLFSAGNNNAINKEEAAKYISAMDGLNTMLRYSKLYPAIWKLVFLPD